MTITLNGKGCNQGKNLEMGRLCWIIWVGTKCNPMYPYKREEEGDLTGDTERRWWEDNRKRCEYLALTFGGMEPQARACWSHQKLKDTGTDPPPKASGQRMTLLTPWSQLPSLQNCETVHYCGFKPLSCGIVTAALGNEIRTHLAPGPHQPQLPSHLSNPPSTLYFS